MDLLQTLVTNTFIDLQMILKRIRNIFSFFKMPMTAFLGGWDGELRITSVPIIKETLLDFVDIKNVGGKSLRGNLIIPVQWFRNTKHINCLT